MCSYCCNVSTLVPNGLNALPMYLFDIKKGDEGNENEMEGNEKHQNLFIPSKHPKDERYQINSE